MTQATFPVGTVVRYLKDEGHEHWRIGVTTSCPPNVDESLRDLFWAWWLEDDGSWGGPWHVTPSADMKLCPDQDGILVQFTAWMLTR